MGVIFTYERKSLGIRSPLFIYQVSVRLDLQAECFKGTSYLEEAALSLESFSPLVALVQP
jgi:hypothetical protein